jgi:non-specific protein-tyrosine kinase
MKLHKVVEKVKSQQQSTGAGVSQQQGKPSVGEGAAEGWVPPVYNEARSIALDEKILRKNRCIGFWPDMPELQHYKMLRAKVSQRMKDKGLRTVMITSIRPGEGKSVTSINLALTFAKAYKQTVLLVDADLRQQSIYRYLGIHSHRGMVDYLVNEVPLKDIIIWPQVEKLTLISGGDTVHDSAELLDSPRMKSLVNEMKHRYTDRCVIFDSPPLLNGADAISLVSLVDGVIIVVESGKTTYKEVEEALELIPGEKRLGLLLNKHAALHDSYYPYYGNSAAR